MAENKNAIADYFAQQQDSLEGLSVGEQQREEVASSVNLRRPANFRERFSESVRAGAQQVESDVKRFGAITNFIRGNEEEAQKQLNYANRLQESYSSIIEPIGNFEEFLDQPTFDGFVDEVSKVGLVVPQAFFSVASGGAGLLTGLLGKAAVSVGGRSAAKKLLKDLQTKKLNNKKGIGPALTPEENEILENVYQGLRAAKYSSAGQAEASRQLAASRAANIPFAQLGFWGGAFAQGEVVGASQSFQEYEDAGYELTADEAKMALLLGLPQAALDTLGERVFFGALTKKLTGDLVSEPRVRKILDKRKAGEALSKADEQVLKAALGDMSAGLFLKDLGKAAASGFLLGGTQEGLVELGQEEILIRQRQAIDPDYGEEEANLRRAEAAFLGFFAGAGRTAPTNTIAKAINLLATGKEISGDIRTEAMALTSAAGADGAAVTGPVPETPRAIVKQIKNLLDGKNPRTVVFVPNTNLEQIVEALRESGLSSEELARIGQFSTNDGFLLFDTNNPLSQADAEKVHKEGLDSEETLRDVLGFTEVQSPLHTTVVTAKDADGDIVFRQTVSDTKEAVDAAVENAQRRNPGATVSVQSKEDAIKESLADAEPTRQGELDLGDPQQPPSAEPQVRDIDEVGDNEFLSIDQQEEFQQTEGQTLGNIAVETADGQQLEFGQLRDAFSIREEPEPIAPLAGPTGKTEFVGLSSLISDRRRQQETPTQEAKDKLFSELPSVRNILDNLPNSFVQALLKAIEQDPSIDINVNTTTRQAPQDQFGPARSEVVYTADVTERGEKAEFNEKVREARQSGDRVFNPKTNDSNVKGMFSIPKKKLDAGQGVKSQEEIVERGINIIPLLNYIIDREGISLTIPTPTRYTQALQILIPEMIENGTPLYYGFAGQRQGIVSYISSYIEDTQKGGEGNVVPVLIPQFQFENGRYVEKQKQVTDEDGITRNKADRIVLNVRELQKARRAPSPVGPDQQANKPETGGNPVRNLFLNILRSDPEGDIAKIYEDFAKKFNKAAEERNKAMPTTTPARITGRPKMSRKFRLLPEKLTPAEIARIREDLSGVGRLDGATKAEFKRRRAGFAQPPLSPEEEALLAKQEIRDQLTPPIPLFATPTPADANIVAVETSTEFGSFNQEQSTQEGPSNLAEEKLRSASVTERDVEFRREQLIDYARENEIEIFDRDTETFGQEEEGEGVSDTDRIAESSVQAELIKNTNVYDHTTSRINREQRRDADNKEFITQRKVTPKKERADKNISATNEVNEYFRTGKEQGGRQLLPFFFNKVAKLFTTDRPIRIYSFAQISQAIADLGKGSDETVTFEGQEITAAELISNIANAAVQKRSLAKYIRIGDRDIIFINTAGQDTRSKVAALYGVAHELGHAVFLNEMNRSLKTPKYKMLMKAFEADKARVEAAGSQKYQGKFGFEEWFADQTAAWLVKTNAKNAVDSFFKRVYERLKSIFDSLNETFKGRFTLNATFEEFINDVAESNKQANQGAEKLSYVQEAEVRDVVEETTRGFKKYMSPKLLQYVKNQMAAILRYSAPKDSVGDHRKHISLNYIFRSAEGYLRSLGPAGKEIARLFYSRSSSKDKFGYLNARVLVVNSYLNDLYSMKDRNGVPLFEDENGEPNIDKLRTITIEAESSTPTNNLSPEARRVREFLTEFFNEYIIDKDKDITPLENFFPRKWNMGEIVADPQKRKLVADLLEKYNDELPEGYNSWLDYVEDWVVTDEDNDTITYNSDEAELSIGMARKRQEYFKKIPTEAARRGLNEAGEINPAGQDAEVLVPSDYAIRAYLEDMIKKLEYEQKVVVTPTEQDVENLRAIYPQKTNKAGKKIEDPRVLNILGTTDTSRKLKELKGWQAMEVLLARIKDDADRQGARKSVEAMLGKVGMDMSPIARKINSWALLGNMVTLLTFAAIASLPDLAGPVIRSRNMTGINTIVEQMSYLFKNKEAAERFARDVGVVTHDSIETMYINAAELGFMTDTTKKYARTFFRVTFLEQYTKFTRVFASLMGQQFLLRLAQDGDAKSLDALAELGVTKQQVLNWQNGGRNFSGADGQAVKIAIGRFVEESIVRPNAAERPVWASNPYTALIWQLKSFFYAYGKNIVGGVKRSMQNNYKQDGNLPSAVYPMLLAGMFLLPLTAIGLELRELIKYLGRGVTPGGRTFEDTAASFRTNNMNWGEYIQELLDRSGIYGPLALLFPMMEAPKYGDSWFFPALGPTAERFEDVFIDGEFDSEDYVPFAGAF